MKPTNKETSFLWMFTHLEQLKLGLGFVQTRLGASPDFFEDHASRKQFLGKKNQCCCVYTKIDVALQGILLQRSPPPRRQ